VQANDKLREYPHDGFVQILDSGEMDANFTVERALASGVASLTGHSLPQQVSFNFPGSIRGKSLTPITTMCAGHHNQEEQTLESRRAEPGNSRSTVLAVAAVVLTQSRPQDLPRQPSADQPSAYLFNPQSVTKVMGTPPMFHYLQRMKRSQRNGDALPRRIG
jgi:hypothetical protein